MKIFLKLILYLYLGVSFIAYILTCLSPFVNPMYNKLIYFSGLAFPIIAFNSILLIIGAGLIKRKYWLLFALIPLLIFCLKFFSFQNDTESIKKSISIYSFNAHSGTMFQNNTTELSRWQSYIAEEGNQPQILCLQEYYPDAKGVYPGASDMHEYSEEKSNLKILSTFPIKKGGEIKDDSGLRFAIYADIQLDDQMIRVYNFHLRSNYITDWLKTDVDTIPPRADRMIAEGEKMVDNIYTAAKIRAMESKKLKWHIKASPYPVIVCGDMNETAQSFAYHQIRGNLKDTFKKGKAGYHPTYLKNPSWVRIDYIFADKQFETVSYKGLPFELSDHRILRVDLK